ncbi:MAG: choice-of-anchor D domain-containing protein, partial [Gammaproteobacteria bacterium]|nr:choice-of-anchor D domain-containing protein [Gammaproteobacteria bacterium]
MEVLSSAQILVRRAFFRATAVLLLACIFATTASAGLLFSGTAVSDAGTDNSIASGNTTRNLAVGADGTIYAVYRGATGGIRVARSVNRGASFQPSVQVSSQNFEAEIAVSTTGIIYVVWADSSSRARISRSLDDGLSFSAPIDAGPASTSVHMATDGSRVYLIDRPGNNILVSEDNGLSFSQVALNASQVFSDIHVDEQTREIIAVLDNPAVKYFTSSDFGASFGAQINPNPGGSIFFSVGTVSSGSGGRFMFVSGQGTNALKINLDTGTSETLTFGNNTSSQGRSLTSDRCGNVIDGFVNGGNVNFRISNDLGSSFGSQQTVAAANAANVFINPTNGDILYLFDQGGEVFLSVFNEELGNCYTPTLNQSALVFSALLVGQTSQPQQVVISNSGIVDVQILGITSTSAEFSQSNACVGTLAVGDSCPIDVTFTPSGTGTRTGELLIDTNVFVDARQVSLTGEGVATAPVPQFSTGSIDFGAVLSGNSANASVQLSNAGTNDLTINGFNVPAPFSVVSEDCGASLIPTASCTINLAFSPTSTGSFNASLVLDSNAAGAPASVALSGLGSSLFSVAGNVSGLLGTGLVLQNNGGDDLLINADGAFVFNTELADGSLYAVTILSQPSGPSQTCSVANGSGNISGADVTNVSVTCSTAQFSVGGSVSGLLGSGLVLQNNAGDNLAIGADGSFSFATALDDGSTYNVSVFSQPASPSQTCAVSNGTGALAGSDISNVSVSCVTNQFTVGGSVSGLVGSGLVLQNNAGDNLAIGADGSFSFATALDDGSTYNVSVFSQPA